MALGAEVVDFVGLDLGYDAGEVRSIRQVAVMQLQVRVGRMRILVDVVDPLRVEKRSTALDAVHLVALLEEKLGQVGAVLAGNAGDECAFQNLFLKL